MALQISGLSMGYHNEAQILSLCLYNVFSVNVNRWSKEKSQYNYCSIITETVTIALTITILSATTRIYHSTNESHVKELQLWLQAYILLS